MGLFTKKTIKDIELNGKTVLLRADYNVPLKNGVITDDYRIKQSIPTIKFLLNGGAKVVIISHLGRPDGRRNLECSLEPVAKRLGKLLDIQVGFSEDCIGSKASDVCQQAQKGDVVLLENLRFYPEEESNDENFARDLLKATQADYFVQDGFGVVHRAHASTDAIARQNVMSVAGLLLEKEVDTITSAVENPDRPLLAIIGGAKIADKIDILDRFMDTAEAVAVVGAMANNFLAAQGFYVGSSLVDIESIKTAKKIITKAKKLESTKKFKLILPIDVVVSANIDGTKPTRVVDLASNTLADINSYPKKPTKQSHSILASESIFDIGPISAGVISGAISLSRTVIWNGTAGVTETKGIAGSSDPFSHGTRFFVESLIGASRKHANRPFSIVGGGDTVGYVEESGLIDEFNHVSTGGGASLELMSGKKLPGVEVLWNKD